MSLSDCASRTSGIWGSSKQWVPDLTKSPMGLSPYGFMTNDTKVNPFFANWNMVWINYCDGSSFTGNNNNVLNYNGQNLYFRGFRNLAAVLDDLNNKGLTSATEAVLTGTSAGGLAVFMHAEYVRTRLPASTVLVAMPDAGFFLDHANVNGQYSFRGGFQSAYGPSLWNGTSGTNAACIATYPPDDRWRCFFAQYLYPFQYRVPFYLINSLYDPTQLGGILQVGCDPTSNCNPTQMAEVNQYRDDFVATLQEVLDNPRDGGFFMDCYQHEQTCQNFDWDGVKINNTLMVDSFTNWYKKTTPNSISFIDGHVGDNPTCVANVAHGGC